MIYIELMTHGKKNAKVNKEQYEKMYDESLSNNENFWSDHGKRIDWLRNIQKIKDVVYSKNVS